MGKKKIWSTLSSKRVYKNPYFSVREDKYIRPDGSVGPYYVTEHKAGICVLPIKSDGKIVLFKQFRYPLNSYSWEGVNGSVEKGEKAKDSASRELQEEAGFKAKSLKYLGSFWPSPGGSTEIGHIFLARGLSPVPTTFDPGESFITKEFSLKQALKMMENGEINDSYTVIALLRLRGKIGDG